MWELLKEVDFPNGPDCVATYPKVDVFYSDFMYTSLLAINSQEWKGISLLAPSSSRFTDDC